MLWKEHLEEQSRHQMQYEVGGSGAGFCLSLTPDNLRQPGWEEVITVPVGLHDVWDARAKYMAQFGMPEPLQR